MQIKGTSAVITGAAGGIGRALAFELTKRQVGSLALVDQSDAVSQVAKAVNELAGSTIAFGYSGDVTDPKFRSWVYRDRAEAGKLVTICGKE